MARWGFSRGPVLRSTVVFLVSAAVMVMAVDQDVESFPEDGDSLHPSAVWSNRRAQVVRRSPSSHLGHLVADVVAHGHDDAAGNMLASLLAFLSSRFCC